MQENRKEPFFIFHREIPATSVIGYIRGVHDSQVSTELVRKVCHFGRVILPVRAVQAAVLGEAR